MRESIKIFLFLAVIFCACSAFAQTRPVVRNYGQLGNNSTVTTDNQGRPVKQNAGGDSLQHRDINEDSVTIFFRYFDSSRIRLTDSSLNDFYSRSGFPYHYYHLGNMGTAAKSYLFSPNMQPGFDPGFHAFDIYKYTIEGTRFFQTTRPYTDLGYLLGGKGEQQINILHTQNRKSNFNFTFEYRLINSPGTYRNQNTSHNNIRLNTYYVSPRKRYSNYAIFINNKLKASENGGLKDPALLNNLSLNDPFELETRLNGEGRPRRDFFNTNVSTGNSYNETYFYFRQHYDVGTRDSLVTDSVTYRLFYPRIRFQHNFKYGSYKYRFGDAQPVDSLYKKYFGYTNPDKQVRFEDRFKEITNEFSVISFPEKNNLNQFLKLGAGLQLIRATFDTAANDNFSNIYFLGEYRNRTRNQKWEIEASAKLFTAGENAADYNALISLKRDLGKRLGALMIGFENVNRTPSYNFRKDTAFPFKRTTTLSKENTSHAFASLTIPRLQLELVGDYYLLTNYTYMDSFFTVKQESTVFNVLHIGATKKFKLSRRWNLYSELHLQQTAGNPPVNVPLVFTRQRLAFEGNFFKNLDLSTGIEIKYHTPYKADGYSPFTGQFIFQDTATIRNRPDINLFFNFRIKRFTAYVRAENLNTFNINSNGARFSKPNFRAVNYPDALLWIRLGIWWKFIN